MPLILRDVKSPRPSAFRCPAWLNGIAGLQRCEDDEGDWVGTWDPLFYRPEQLAKGATWIELPDDWKLALVGELIPSLLLRSEHSLPLIVPVADRFGRAWHAPVVLVPHSGTAAPSAEGTIALSLSWGRDPATGAPARVPTPSQAKLIATAQAARAEILANRLKDLPISTAVEMCAVALEEIYHLDLDVMLRGNLLDDVLAGQTLMAIAGFPLQLNQAKAASDG